MKPRLRKSFPVDYIQTGRTVRMVAVRFDRLTTAADLAYPHSPDRIIVEDSLRGERDGNYQPVPMEAA